MENISINILVGISLALSLVSLGLILRIRKIEKAFLDLSGDFYKSKCQQNTRLNNLESQVDKIEETSEKRYRYMLNKIDDLK